MATANSGVEHEDKYVFNHLREVVVNLPSRRHAKVTRLVTEDLISL